MALKTMEEKIADVKARSNGLISNNGTVNTGIKWQVDGEGNHYYIDSKGVKHVKTITPSTKTEATVEKTPEEIAAEEAAELEKRTFGLGTTSPTLNWTDVATPTRPESAAWTGKDMDSALYALQEQYNRNMGTTRTKSEADIQQQAAADYASYYDQLRTAAGNEYLLNDLALLQQKEGLASTYDKNRKASAQNYAEAYSQADRALLNRGMQRSSYGAQTLSNVALKGAEAQQAIWDAQVAAEGNVDAQRQQLLSNYARTMQGYDAGQASDVMSRVWDLRDTEYDRQVTRANTLNQLATQLYGYINSINEVNREQYNTDRTLGENQYQFDTGVAQARQSVEDARTQYAATLAEEMRQYNNSSNLNELSFQAQYPNYGYTRAEDGRLVRDSGSSGWNSGTSSGVSEETLQALLDAQNSANKTSSVDTSAVLDMYARQAYQQAQAANKAKTNSATGNASGNVATNITAYDMINAAMGVAPGNSNSGGNSSNGLANTAYMTKYIKPVSTY